MQARRDWRTWALVLACVLPFVGFWATGLTDLDEGFYSAVVTDMMRRGDWITPTINGEPWFEKPILLYWLAIPSVEMFGVDFGPRLPAVLCTLATAFVLFRFVRRHFDLGLARLVAAGYCGSLIVLGLGRMMMTDAPFVLALTVAFTTFWESINGNQKMRTWTAVALGFAMLAKGPVAGLFFLLTAGFVYWRLKELRPNFKGHWLLGIALFFVIVGAWYVPCYLANGDVFVQKFLIEQNIGRFQGGDKAHAVPVWSHPIYFPAVLFLGLMPWSWWALRAKWFEWPTDPLRRYFWIWGLIPLVFFTVSKTKLPHYILPAVAPLLVVTLLAVVERREEQGQHDFWLKMSVAWSLIIGGFATLVFQTDYQNRFEEVHKIARYVSEQEGKAVIFRTGRENSDVSISLNINESPPLSALIYLQKEAILTDDVAEAVTLDGDLWLITRADRFDDDVKYDFILSGYMLTEVDLPFKTKKWELWKLDLTKATDLVPND